MISTLINCPNRIKPKLLREQKTEALLVFIRTTLEQSFEEIDNKGYQFMIGTQEDNDFIYSTLKKLLEHLQDCVVNSTYIRSLTFNVQKNKFLIPLLKKEEPLIVYYDSIVRALEVKLKNGTPWIPELMVISLLSEWILEEEKSVYLYPFLKDIDYLDLITKYDHTKMQLESDKKEVVMNMYRLSSYLIMKLKEHSYKSSKKNTKTKRKKKK